MRFTGVPSTTLGLGFLSDGGFNALRAVKGPGVYGHVLDFQCTAKHGLTRVKVKQTAFCCQAASQSSEG